MTRPGSAIAVQAADPIVSFAPSIASGNSQPAMSAGRQLGLLAALGAGILAILGVQYALYLHDQTDLITSRFFPWFVATWACACGLYLVAVWRVRRGLPRGGLALVLAFAVLLRIVPIVAPDFLSGDLYRYVWDGRVQNAGFNPYCCVPASPELAGLRDAAIYPNINRAGYAPTIYPPAAQMLFAVIAWVSQTPVAVKLAMALCDAISCACLLTMLRRAALPLARVLIFAWHPLLLWEFDGNGHVDAAATAWLALAMLASTSSRPWLQAIGAGFAMAGATLTKFLPVVVSPALWRRDPRLPIAFVVAIAAGYACYASVGMKVFGFLGGYTHEEGLSDGSGIYWLRIIGRVVTLPSWAGKAWLGLTAVMLAVIALVVTWRAPRANTLSMTGAHATVLATTLIVMIAPHYGWYFGWLVLLACLTPWPSVLWLTVSCIVFNSLGVEQPLAWESVIYVPFLILAALDVARQRRRA
jgi:hypothetical protein